MSRNPITWLSNVMWPQIKKSDLYFIVLILSFFFQMSKCTQLQKKMYSIVFKRRRRIVIMRLNKRREILERTPTFQYAYQKLSKPVEVIPNWLLLLSHTCLVAIGDVFGLWLMLEMRASLKRVSRSNSTTTGASSASFWLLLARGFYVSLRPFAFFSLVQSSWYFIQGSTTTTIESARKSPGAIE